jgi:hypothetical protein
MNGQAQTFRLIGLHALDFLATPPVDQRTTHFWFPGTFRGGDGFGREYHRDQASLHKRDFQNPNNVLLNQYSYISALDYSLF